MATKRLLAEPSDDSDWPGSKRMRKRPSFASVIGEVLMVNSLQNFCSALEPLLRRVVNEEIERSLQHDARTISRYPTPHIKAQVQETSTLHLSFTKKLSLPVFTGSKVEYEDTNQLHVILVNPQADQGGLTTLPHPIKVEIVVLDGEFLPDDHKDWTAEQFNSKIVRERTGKRPLVTGDVLVTMRDGYASIGDLVFTDNSSWIRSRTFRLGARVEHGSQQDFRIREAITEAFVVKDHRGELYKKHHPPSLNDEVWRLEKIGKDGAFHRKLSTEGVNTVQEFLKLWIVEPARLRTILGVGMSDKMFEMVIKHAKTCNLDNKQYMLRGPGYTIILSPICQVVGVMFDGKTYSTRDLTAVQRAHVESLVREAYVHGNALEEADGLLLNENALLPLDDISTIAQYPDHLKRPNKSCRLLMDGSIDVSYPCNVPLLQQSDCSKHSKHLGQQIDDGSVTFIPEMISSHVDSTPSSRFFIGM